MVVHTIELERRALHGTFSRDFAPILEIDPGDTVRFRTLDAGWGVEGPRADGPERARFQPRDPERDAGHALIGPICVRDAQPGMTLVVRIGELRPGAFGWTDAGGWETPLNRRLGVVDRRVTLRWAIDADAGTARDQFGHLVPLRPFLGVLGMPPADSGVHSTTPPRPTGGNIDCRELVSGSTLYLPIAVPGALLSAGDGHAAQGDGEVCGTAIECPMELVELTIELRDDLRLRLPRADTPAGRLTFGFDADLNEAMAQALEGMLELMGEQHGLGRLEALALASVLVNLRVTQVANRVWGVHALLPRGSVVP
jgi:acetamidase/formamidase